jgi:hypothetical protein
MPRYPIRWAAGVLLTVAAATSASAQGGDGPATEAFRRQAKGRERARQEFFDRLRQVPEAAPLPPPAPLALIVLAQPAIDGERGEDDEDEAPPRPIGVLAPENFDHWVFRDGAGAVGDAGRRDRLEAMLAIKAERTARAHRLAPAEAEKLRLAGRGDVKHFFDRLARLRREFDGARRDRAAGLDFLGSLQDERTTYQEGPFGDGSLFDKTLARLLADRRPDPPRSR